MADSMTLADPVVGAVGFKMNNLKSFPFYCLPGSFQMEVIEEVGIFEKIHLFNVNSGFREYFVRNGFFGRHVDEIVISLIEVGINGDVYRRNLDPGPRFAYLRVSIRTGTISTIFDSPYYRRLFRNICSCDRLIIEPWQRRDLNLIQPPFNGQLEEILIKEDTDGKRIGEWFPNLRLVKRLSVTGLLGRFLKELERLEFFHFKVTELAKLCDHSVPSSPWIKRWEHLLENQFSICQNVLIDSYWEIPDTMKIPGVEIVNDPKKRRETLDAFKEKFEPQFKEDDDGHLLDEKDLGSCGFEINCYRRKIDEDNEMILLVIQDMV